MTYSSRFRRLALAPALAAIMMMAPTRSAMAHCDSVDGPVVTSARRALALGDVTPVLKWVGPEHEADVAAVFTHVLAVRTLGDEARALADRFFFETLVRVHREGEGAPYSGLKEAGSPVSPAVIAADEALESGSDARLVADLTEAIAAGVRSRFEHAQAARAHAEDSVAAGREFVAAYVEFTHYVEGLEALAAGHSAEHEAAPGTAILASTQATVAAPAAAKSQVFELPANTGFGDSKKVTVLVDESYLKLATVAMRGGTVLPSHSAPVPTTIQVLDGDGVIHVAGEPLPATKGTIVLLGAGEDHDVVPAPDSDMLLLVHYLRSPADLASAQATSHNH